MNPGKFLSLSALAVAALLPLPAQDAPKADFGNYNSGTLVNKSWAANAAKNTEEVKTYVGMLRKLYEPEALKQQASLSAPVPAEEKDKVMALWALNDVGTGLFILGQALERSGDKTGALEAYKFLAEKLPYARCWDSKGWFWSPADAARGRVKVLEFDAD